MKPRFIFKCTAFGMHYFDCLFQDSSGRRQTVEVCTDGFIESHPVLTYRYSVQITDPELLSGWREYCQGKRTEYLAFLEHNPHCKEFSKLQPFREVVA